MTGEDPIDDDPRYIKMVQYGNDTRRELLEARAHLETLVYCISERPRLFRWYNGVIQWADPIDDCNPNQWHDLPEIQRNTEKDSVT